MKCSKANHKIPKPKRRPTKCLHRCGIRQVQRVHVIQVLVFWTPLPRPCSRDGVPVPVLVLVAVAVLDTMLILSLRPPSQTEEASEENRSSERLCKDFGRRHI